MARMAETMRRRLVQSYRSNHRRLCLRGLRGGGLFTFRPSAGPNRTGVPRIRPQTKVSSRNWALPTRASATGNFFPPFYSDCTSELRLVVLDCRCVYHLATIPALVWWKAGGTPEVSVPKPNPNVVHVILRTFEPQIHLRRSATHSRDPFNWCPLDPAPDDQQSIAPNVEASIGKMP